MIELNRLSFSYSKAPFIQDLTLTLPKERVTAIIGLNGCGKSTLLKLCCGLLAPTAGDILIGGDNLCRLSPKEKAQRISLMLQGYPPSNLTADQIVLAGRNPHRAFGAPYTPLDKDIALESMEKTGCLHLRRQELRRLSGGERQRVFLAMTLAQQTAVLLLDEPTAALDIHTALEFLNLVREFLLQERKTVVMVLHDLDLALRYADFIAVMDRGALLHQGSPDEIVSSGVLEQLFQVNTHLFQDRGQSFYCFSAKK